MFPLTGQLWLDWVADEQKIAATEEEKSKVLGLLQRGVGDYLSVDLWLERCMVGMQGMGTSAGAAESRYVQSFNLNIDQHLRRFLTGGYLRRQ